MTIAITTNNSRIHQAFKKTCLILRRGLLAGAVLINATSLTQTTTTGIAGARDVVAGEAGVVLRMSAPVVLPLLSILGKGTQIDEMLFAENKKDLCTPLPYTMIDAFQLVERNMGATANTVAKTVYGVVGAPGTAIGGAATGLIQSYGVVVNRPIHLRNWFGKNECNHYISNYDF